jgi:hypothetical protein
MGDYDDKPQLSDEERFKIFQQLPKGSPVYRDSYIRRQQVGVFVEMDIYGIVKIANDFRGRDHYHYTLLTCDPILAFEKLTT